MFVQANCWFMASLVNEIVTDVFHGKASTQGKPTNWAKKAADKARLAVLEIAGSLTSLRRVCHDLAYIIRAHEYTDEKAL